MFDFGISFSEVIILAGLALIVLGPQDFPKILYQMGKFMRYVQNISHEFKQSVDDIVHEQEIIKLKQDIETKINAEQAKADTIFNESSNEPPKNNTPLT